MIEKSNPSKQPQKLEKIKRTNGFVYKQIKRSPRYAIYAQMYDLDSNPIAYEVIEIEKGGGKIMKGRYFPPKEKFPRPSTWGLNGWSYRSMKDAIAKYESLVEKETGADQLLTILLKEQSA